MKYPIRLTIQNDTQFMGLLDALDQFTQNERCHLEAEKRRGSTPDDDAWSKLREVEKYQVQLQHVIAGLAG